MSASSSSLLLAAAAFLLAGSAAPEPVPQIHFVYPAPAGSVFDRVCPHWMNRTPSPADVREVLRRKSEFEAQWRTVGETYLRLAIDAAGTPFPYREMQATLSVCAPDSMAMPLIISMNDLLSSNAGTPYAHDFPLLVFHEVMHHYSLPIEAVSALRSRYASEPGDVLSHLHVIAFEQYVLTRSGRIAERDRLKNYYFTHARPPYRRAWEIVERETPEAFIAEINARNAGRPAPQN